MTALNHTHEPAARSWVASANTPGTDFPIQNLPLAVFRHYQEDEAFRGGVAIGDQVIDLARVVVVGCLEGLAAEAALAGAYHNLNVLMALGPKAWQALRHGLFDLLNSIKQATTDPAWLGMATEGYVFAALVFWIFCFGMSRYSMHLERKLDTGHKR